MDKLKEQVSAMVDDELEAHEIPLVLKQLASDTTLAQSIQHYQAMGQQLRQSPLGATPVTVDLLAGINQALDAEPAVALDEADGEALGRSAAAPKKISVFEQIAGVAIAASVAMIAVFMVQTVPSDTGEASFATTQTPPPGTFWQSQQPVVEARLNAYLVKHNQNVVPAFRGPGNVHLVSYDGGQK